MRFGYTADQVAFAAAVHDLLARECPPAAVRAAWDAEPGKLDRGLWDKLAEMGVLATVAPEAAGGLGLDLLTLVAILEEAGRAGLPHPLVETAAVAAPLGVADGRLVTASLGGQPAPCADDADAVLVDHEGSLLLCRPDHVVLEPLAAVDRARRLAVVAAVGPDAEVLTDDPDEVAAAFDRAALGTAAVLVGLGQTMLDMTVAYVKERHQFGVPVGSFQAVKHHLADAAKELAFARPAVQRAAVTLEPAHVSMAKAMASEAASFVGRQALQCHGAIGYTVEHDLHLFLKRTWALSRAHGDPAFHRARLARSLHL